MDIKDKRLIEHGFPCHQVGAETQRERGASSALPPLYYLHVWWARRPLTPSRAAILASLLPADTDPELFVRSLGIEKVQALVNEEPWTLTGKLIARLQHDKSGNEILPVDEVVLRSLEMEDERRTENRKLIETLKAKDSSLANDPVLLRWEKESQPLPRPFPETGDALKVQRFMGDPAWAKDKLAFTKKHKVHFPGDAYGYSRAFQSPIHLKRSGLTILDPVAGGGSIPIEALRLGHNVIVNELNPVALVILYATLDYPARFGKNLIDNIKFWGNKLLLYADEKLKSIFPNEQTLNAEEQNYLKKALVKSPELLNEFNFEKIDDYIYCRQVTCPHCGGDAPLLNSCWLSKEDRDQWGARIIPDGNSKNEKVRFETYRAINGRGPDGEDPNMSTVSGGVGTCIHCKQAITSEEIKAQARGESQHGKWKDRLYCIVAKRFEPKLDKNGNPERFNSGLKKGEIKTKKIRFFRPPNNKDLQALDEAEKRLSEKWAAWEVEGLIPTEKFPEGNDNRPIIYGMARWCDMFTPRQLLGHLTLIEGLNKLKPQILEELGNEKGRAVITYLQFAIDKGVDYNSRQTLWHAPRGVIAHTFTRHDYSFKWTFGEMIFTGPNSGAAWGLSQVIDAYSGIAALLEPVHRQSQDGGNISVEITNYTAAHMPMIADKSVDLICMDPPYYNNVQYAELSDYFYVWQKRTLKDLYPEVFHRRLTNKKDEAVANPFRDDSANNAKKTYERMMSEIFAESRRVLKDDGLMTLMFTHKSQDAWEALTRSLIESGWAITASFPIESEPSQDIHHKDVAAAASSIFISCRKREQKQENPATWTGLGGQGVQQQIRRAVEVALDEFKPLHLNPVDQMVACYGRALHVLSEQWPVIDGDIEVSPIRAMNEASRVVAENEIKKITDGRLLVDDLDTETAMALILFGVWGFNEFSYDEALNISKSLNIALVGKSGGYRVEGHMIGISQAKGGRREKSAQKNINNFHAPLARQGSKLRLAKPEERHENRLSNPQTAWDILHGIIMEYRRGDMLRVRPYLEKHTADDREKMLNLLQVWIAENDDPKLKKEGEAILFGLK